MRLRAIKVKNGVVIESIIVDKIPEGWIDDVLAEIGIGYIDNNDGTFLPPIEVKTQAEIDAQTAIDKAVNLKQLRDDAIDGLLNWAESDATIPANVKAKITAFKAKKPK